MRDPEFFMHRYAPSTAQMAFFKLPVEEFADRLLERERWVTQNAELPWTVTREEVNGALEDKLPSLLPLTSVWPTKKMVTQTNSCWTALIANQWTGGDVQSPSSYLSKAWNVEVITIILVRDVPRGQPGSMQFIWYGLSENSSQPRYRSVAAHKESRWEFHEYGDRLPFEDVARYGATRIKDRLTPEMIENYCAHFGLSIFDPDFYAGKGYVINAYPPPNEKFHPRFPNQG